MEDATGLSRARPGVAARRAAALAMALVGLACGPAAAQSTSEQAAEHARQAHEAAARDDHAAAIDHATRALALDATLEDELTRLLANQLTWADRPAEAIPFFRRALARHPNDRDLRHGLARALSWADRPGEARAVYEELAADDPTDLDARLGVARMHAWNDEPSKAAAAYRAALAQEPGSTEALRGLADAENRLGLHRAAERRYEELLAQDANDHEAREGLARARYWMGENDAALTTLGEPAMRDGQALRTEIEHEAGVRVDLSAARWIDVDDQELQTVGLQVDVGLSAGRRFLAEAHRFRTDEPGTPPIDGGRYGVGVDQRFDRRLALHARVSLLDVGSGLDDSEVVDVGEGETRTAEEVRARYLLWDGWLTWTPRDRTRFDLSHSRVPIYTPRALARGIRADVLGLGADRSLSNLWVVRASGAWSEYTDENRRLSGEAEVEAGPFRFLRRPKAWIGAGLAAFTFEESVDRGYYSPENYDAIFGRARVETAVGSRVTIEADLRLASERENGDDRFGVAAGGVELRVGLGRGFGFGAFVRRSTSRLDSGAGYERDGWGVSLFHGP